MTKGELIDLIQALPDETPVILMVNTHNETVGRELQENPVITAHNPQVGFDEDIIIISYGMQQ